MILTIAPQRGSIRTATRPRVAGSTDDRWLVMKTGGVGVCLVVYNMQVRLENSSALTAIFFFSFLPTCVNWAL